MKIFKTYKDKNGTLRLNIDEETRKKISRYLDSPNNQGVTHVEEFYEDGKTKSLTSYLGKLKFDKVCVDTSGCICQYTLYVD